MFKPWHKLSVSSKLLIGFDLVVSIFIFSSLFIFKELKDLTRTAHQATRVDAPRALAGKEIQYRLVTGHLWLEEMLTGDTSISLERILEHWEVAKTTAEVMLEGGEVDGQSYPPVTDEAARTALTKLIDHLTRVNALTLTRHEQMLETGTSVAGSASDQAFDALFHATLEPAKALETTFTEKSVRSSRRVDQVSEAVRSHLIKTLILVIISSILIPFVFSHFVVIRPLSFLQKSCIQLSSSANTMAAHAMQQEASAKEQSATTHEIAASTKEISDTSQTLVVSMEEVAQAVDQTAQMAEDGRTNLTRMEKTIGHMVEASQSIGAKLSLLNEKATNITTVVTTINKVADQTNLLSVNAAIEADKAGEYGIGFGTVASEIRRLADQTAIATSDIEEMVKEMQSAVSAGVMGMEKFSNEVQQGVADVQQVGQQLAHIIGRVQTLGPHFESVHQGMNSQAEGAEQISEALGQLSETMRSTSETIVESHKIIEGLNEESTKMRTAVEQFRLAS